jgi:hypothetical protein
MHSILLVAAASFLVAVQAYGLNLPKRPDGIVQSNSVPRQNFLSIAVGGLTAGLLSDMAWAKDADAVKGTKQDPVYQECLSQCK